MQLMLISVSREKLNFFDITVQDLTMLSCIQRYNLYIQRKKTDIEKRKKFQSLYLVFKRMQRAGQITGIQCHLLIV